MFNFITLSGEAAAGGGAASILTTLLPIAVIFLVFYFILIRPQKKKDKEAQQMRTNIEIGDELTTIGGIIGLVVSIREDTVVLETGNDRSKIRIARWAIQQNNTPHPVEAAAAPATDKKEKKEKKEK